MKIEILDRRPEGRQLARALQWRLKQALARLDGPVTGVSLTLNDLNGPRGGLDQDCQLIIALAGEPPVVIHERAETVQQATGNAIARARRSLARRIKKRQHRRRQWPGREEQAELLA